MPNREWKNRLTVIALVAAFVITCIGSTAEFESGCENVRENVLRLHVIASSDSEYDQDMKLKVRDAVLGEESAIFSGCRTLVDAQKAAQANLPRIESAARRTLIENGCDKDVRVSIEKTGFETRSYGEVTLPAGEYKAVRVVIGEGKGHNWWCVLFPPLCLPACTGETELSDVLNKKGLDVVNASPRYEIRFKIVEWVEEIRSDLKNKKK